MERVMLFAARMNGLTIRGFGFLGIRILLPNTFLFSLFPSGLIFLLLLAKHLVLWHSEMFGGHFGRYYSFGHDLSLIEALSEVLVHLARLAHLVGISRIK